MANYSIGKKLSTQLVKVEVNEYGDAILINPSDATFPQKYNELLKWFNAKEVELSEKSKEYEKKYDGKPMISYGEDGSVEADTEQLEDFYNLQIGLYTEVAEKIDGLVGTGTIKKYFRVFYENNPDFVPDDECYADFFEEITPVLSDIFQKRFEQVRKKYNKNRKGNK